MVEAQNSHDAKRMASCFAEEYRSSQPVHPGREFTGRAQVLANWTSVFAGVPDFEARAISLCRDGDTEWGEFDWSGSHTDGSPFAMRGIIIAMIRDDLIAEARLYVEPVEQVREDIEAAVEKMSGPSEVG